MNTASTDQSKTAADGAASWVTLVSMCIDCIGKDEFSEHLIAALRSLTNFDNSVVFAYYRSERPVCLFHTFSPENRVVFVDDYLKGPYLLDPFFKACARKIEPGLYRLRTIAPDRFYQSEYYRSYYIQTGLAEEICYAFYLPNGVSVVVSLMRAGESSRFSAREFRMLDNVAPIVISLAKRHWEGVPGEFNLETVSNGADETSSLIERTVQELFSERITPRETQVVAQVLEGHSSDSIAKSLGISVGTVRIHRRNIYAKLQISSQQELFAIFFKKITEG